MGTPRLNSQTWLLVTHPDDTEHAGGSLPDLATMRTDHVVEVSVDEVATCSRGDPQPTAVLVQVSCPEDVEVVGRVVGLVADVPVIALVADQAEGLGIDSLGKGAAEALLRSEAGPVELRRAARNARDASPDSVLSGDSRKLFDALLRTVSDGLLVLDQGPTIVDANDSARELLRPFLGDRELVGLCLADWPAPAQLESGDPLEPDDLPLVRASRTLSSVAPTVVGCIAPDGTTTWFETQATVLHDTRQLLASFRDVTEIHERSRRQQRRFELVQLQARVHEILSAQDLSDPESDESQDLDDRSFCDAICEAFVDDGGYGAAVLATTTENELERLWGRSSGAPSPPMGLAASTTSTEAVDADGRRWFAVGFAAGEWSGRLLLVSAEAHHADSDAERDLLAQIASDVGHALERRRLVLERRASDAARRAVDLRYRHIVESASEGIVLLDLDGSILMANQAMADIVGWPDPRDGIGLSMFDFVVDSDHDYARRALAARAGGEAAVDIISIRHADGSVRTLRYSASPVKDENGQVESSLAMALDVTDQVAAEVQVALQASMLDRVGEAVVAFDVDRKVRYWNLAAEQMFGYRSDEAVGRRMLELVGPIGRDAPELLEEMSETLAAGQRWTGRLRLARRNGSDFPAYISISPLDDSNASLPVGIGVAFDLTQLEQAERRAERRARNHSVIASFGEEVLAAEDLEAVLHRATRVLTDVLPASTSVVALLDEDDELDVRASHDISGQGSDHVAALLDVTVSDAPTSFGHRVMHAAEAAIVDDLQDQTGGGGRMRAAGAPLKLRGRPVGLVAAFGLGRTQGAPSGDELDHNEVPAGREAAEGSGHETRDLIRSVTSIVAAALEAERHRAELDRRSVEDPLTGLPNRPLFIDRLERAVQRRSTTRDARLAVVVCDVDDFNAVNREMGEQAGDTLLAMIGSRLGSVLERDDTLARIAGDQFAVLREDLEGAAEALGLAEQLVRSVGDEPFELGGGRSLSSAISVGISLVGEGTEAADSLLMEATAAMLAAKESGGNTAEVYDAVLRAELESRAKTAAALRGAVGRGELRLLYQPEISTTDDTIWAEALVRWCPDGENMVAPAAFLGVAEDVGLLPEIDRWVLEEAVSCLAAWKASGQPAPSSISVNLSPRQFADGKMLIERFAQTLARHGVDPSSLWVEVTETAVMANLDQAAKTLRGLKELGIGVALDDFGTGYSSLTFVRDLPADALKIDRSFVSGIGSDLRDQTIVELIVGLAHSAGLVAIAEGVETRAQEQALRALGCDYIQGYLISRPIPAEALIEWVRARG